MFKFDFISLPSALKKKNKHPVILIITNVLLISYCCVQDLVLTL